MSNPAPIDPARYPRLSRIDSPADLRRFDEGELPAIADELRAYLIESVGRSGGHFGAGLGVIELTTALHYLYDTPEDRIVWDVGHQCYPHKILTGRRDNIHTVKQKDGVAPFPKRDESPYDTFGVGHSSTSISAALGMAIANQRAGFVVSELKQVGVEATLKQIDTAQWHPMVTRREFQIGANLTGLGLDDPDANFYENYACGSPRNYGDYCSEDVSRLIEQQSQEIDQTRRLALVWQIQKKLEEDAARPTMGWRTDRFAHYPYVRNLILNQVTYNCCRLQEVWLDK